MNRNLAFALKCFVAMLASGCLANAASAISITGTVEPTTPLGQYLALKMTIDEATTKLELTGPDYSFFAFGFDTTTMKGYSLIVQPIDINNPTVVEQNLVAVGSPGNPQLMQNVDLVDLIHDSANHLMTLVLERSNHTGDANDPDFTTGMSSLNLIWAYDSFATPDDPNPYLTYHGSSGRGLTTITFSPVPEPASCGLLAIAAGTPLIVRRRRATRVQELCVR